MKQFFTPHERITKDNRPLISHKNLPVDRPDDRASTRFKIRFWDKMIEVTKVKRLVSTDIPVS